MSPTSQYAHVDSVAAATCHEAPCREAARA